MSQTALAKGLLATSSRGRRRPGLKSVRGHSGEGPAKKWPIVCYLVEGCTHKEIGAKLSRSFTTTWSAARKMGFHDSAKARTMSALYDFGEPFTVEAVRALKSSSGLSVGQLATRTGLPASVITGTIRPRRKYQRVAPEIAKKILTWRDSVIRQLLSTAAAPARGEDRFSGSRILKTFFPDLGRKRGQLLSVLRRTRSLLNSTAGIKAHELGELFCTQAMLEVGRCAPQRTFAQSLPWLPAVMTFLQANFGRLAGNCDLWRLADEAIAWRWDTSAAIVSGVSRSRVQPILQSEMRMLLRETVPSAPPSTRRRPGPRVSPIQSRAEFIGGRNVEAAIPRISAICRDLLTLPRRARTNLDRASLLLDGRNYSRQELAAAVRSPGDPLVAARWFISITTRKEYGVVAKYHQFYRRAVANPDQI